jgi:hypothetical protein
MKEEEDTAKEAFTAPAFASLVFCPGGRQTSTIFLALGIPRTHRNRPEGGIPPGHQLQAPRGGIQAKKAWTDLGQPHGPGHKRVSKRSIMNSGWRQEKKTVANLIHGTSRDGPDSHARVGAGAELAHDQRRHLDRHGATENGSALDHQIACPNQPRTDGDQDALDKERLWKRGCGPLPTFAEAREGRATRRQPSVSKGKPHAKAKAGQARHPSRLA